MIRNSGSGFVDTYSESLNSRSICREPVSKMRTLYPKVSFYASDISSGSIYIDKPGRFFPDDSVP